MDTRFPNAIESLVSLLPNAAQLNIRKADEKTYEHWKENPTVLEVDDAG